jgi:hypothetical protein
MADPFGGFTEEALAAYQKALDEKEGVEFSEKDTYDFTTCIRPDGSAYGTAGKCRKGTEGEAKKKEPKGEPKGKSKEAVPAPTGKVPSLSAKPNTAMGKLMKDDYLNSIQIDEDMKKDIIGAVKEARKREKKGDSDATDIPMKTIVRELVQTARKKVLDWEDNKSDDAYFFNGIDLYEQWRKKYAYNKR